MNRSLPIAALLALAACAPPPPAAPAPNPAELASLYRARDCFGLRDALRDARGDLSFYRAAEASAFDRADDAVAHARRFTESPAARGDTLLGEAYSIMGEAHARAYRYADAARAYSAALTHVRDSAARAEAENAAGLWGALAAVPPQTVERAPEVRLETARDKAGLLTTQVEVGGKRLPFVWDTGAGLSTISDSTAVEMGLRIVEAAVQVGSITGTRTPARLAIAPELRIGGATVRNAVFLVLPAARLSFPQIDYRIHGIVGYPVIAALGPTTYLRAGGIVLEAPAAASRPGAASNLCLDGMSPRLAIGHAGRRMHVGLDTGAQTTSLFPPFLAANREEVMKGTETTVGIGGAAGVRRVRAYTLSSVQLDVAGRAVTLQNVRVLSEPTMERSEFLFGNLGQDVFSQLESMTLDFRAMEMRAR
ncbi:MAG TPA: pepsin/retropepsin-like aspartic protease family protein [Longimicrobium sp.]|nr:pepsin/retropepsin-like aspartic protease family protein [Longimicrobium sp.]